MLFPTTLAAVAALAPFVSAHGGRPGIPNIVGLNPRDLKARSLLGRTGARFTGVNELLNGRGTTGPAKQVKPRQDSDQCGEGVGSCAAGLCCSPEGWCGTTVDYCYSPGCQYEYGPGCPENQTPSGSNTSSVTRTQLGDVEYGGNGIYGCTVDGTVAITYDDGPLQNYTSHILDVLASHGAKATFFITGNNLGKGEIDTTAELTADIQRMDTDGHQIASHTWTHLDLSAISATDRLNQMIKNEMAFRNILGKFPTYMRPPYSSCTAESGCEDALKTLGYHITYFDLDTDDYEHDDPTLIQYSKDVFYGNVTEDAAASSTWLEIGHDIHEQTAYNLTDYMLTTLTSLGYTAVTVGECLGDSSDNWYRSADGASTATSSTATSGTASATSSAASSTATTVSTDATCGGTTGYTCSGSSFGNCCSAAGWCGSTTDYCDTGCQSGFGTCGSSSASSSAAAATTSSAAASSAAASSTKASTSSSAPAASASAASSGTVSTDATCGGTSGYTCLGSSFGDCCSANGWCGSTTDYCSTGCQSGFGSCTGSTTSSVKAAGVTTTSVKTSTTTTAKTSTVKTSTSTSTSAAATAAVVKSTDGTCGGTTGFTCTGAGYGKCCSQYGWCGKNTAHCGTGCQSGFGTCS